jgi:regulator of nucleoside diphosphate kinase
MSMARPQSLHLRASDVRVLEGIIQNAAGGRDADCAALLDEELARATVVPDHALPSGTVALDSRVRFRDERTGRVRDVTLVLPSRATASEGRISVLSPIGSALIGLAVDDRIEWPLPGGRSGRLRVLAVS